MAEFFSNLWTKICTFFQPIGNWFAEKWAVIYNFFASGQFWEWFKNNAIDVLIWFLGVFLSILVTRLINKLFDWIREKAKNEKQNRMLSSIENILTACTKATTQTFVSGLKNSEAFDAVAQKEAMQRTLVDVNNQLTKEMKSYIKTQTNDVESYLTSKVESILEEEKRTSRRRR